MQKVFFAPDEMCTTLKLQLNRVQDFFRANNWEIAESAEQADKIICGICVGWDSLEDASIKSLTDHKQYGEKVVALGCVSGLNQEQLYAIHKGPVIPSYQLSDVDHLVEGATVSFNEVPVPSVFRSKQDYRLYDLSKRFVTVSTGCAFSCAYCLHKVGIGERKSRPLKDIITQVSDLAARGDIKTIVIMGLETGLYGREIGTDFAQMLKELLSVSGSMKINIGQFHPSGILHYEEAMMELLSNPKITDIQIPIQTTSARLLALMNRPELPPRLSEVVRYVAQKNPAAIIRSDLIIGYPTETMEELAHAVQFAAEHFDEISLYAFEQKRGLPAQDLAGQLTPQEIQKRREYCERIINEKGKLCHSGSQVSIGNLNNLEQQRQEQRSKKACAYAGT